MNFLVTVEQYCQDLDPILRFVRQGIIPIFQIGIPIILIVLGMLDLGKAVVASKEDEIKKATTMLVKRAIYAVAVFFIVTIVSLVFGLFSKTKVDENGDIQGTASWRTCWDEAGK